MRQTLRRSCSACAKSKHSCDLRTPRCSRCIKRRVECLYANEPLTVSLYPPASGASSPDAGPLINRSFENRPLDSGALYNLNFASLDPFDSYPKTRLPRQQVQRLIHAFLNKISFQYYPLDLSLTSNPFLISWWPLALGDPALFHVSLQTACLDEELIAQRGFHSSEILMADSVALLRRKVQDPVLAIQDGTMNSVITLAAIEFGKGNTRVAEMHVDGVKRLVNMRGGINSVRQTSPLTARMISWVSMLILGYPQFDTQDDVGRGNGIPPPPEWQLDFSSFALEEDLARIFGSGVNVEDIDYQVSNVFIRLHDVFYRAQTVPLHNTRLHDLTCFVVHRLLPSCREVTETNTDETTGGLLPQISPSPGQKPSPITECIRYAMILYMLITQGPIYYSHHVVLNNLVERLIQHLKELDLESSTAPEAELAPGMDNISSNPPAQKMLRDPLDIWLVAVGLVAAADITSHYEWFADRASQISLLLLPDGEELYWEEDILVRIKSVLWLDRPGAEDIFRTHWEAILGVLNIKPAEGDRCP